MTTIESAENMLSDIRVILKLSNDLREARRLLDKAAVALEWVTRNREFGGFTRDDFDAVESFLARTEYVEPKEPN